MGLLLSSCFSIMPSIFLSSLLRDLLSPECTFKKLKQAVFWFNLCVRSSFPNPMTLYTGFTNNRMVGWAANHSSKRLLPLPAVQRATRTTSVPGKSVQNFLQELETGRKDQVLAIHELEKERTAVFFRVASGPLVKPSCWSQAGFNMHFC